jgi:cytosine/uracil/thiamine/allantoin permease
MRAPGTPRILQGACVCALAALAMMAWSLFDPRPLPVVAAMSVGQVLGTLSFLSFLYVVATDLRRVRQTTPAKTDPSAPGAE